MEKFLKTPLETCLSDRTHSCSSFSALQKGLWTRFSLDTWILFTWPTQMPLFLKINAHQMHTPHWSRSWWYRGSFLPFWSLESTRETDNSDCVPAIGKMLQRSQRHGDSLLWASNSGWRERDRGGGGLRPINGYMDFLHPANWVLDDMGLKDVA